MWLKQVDASSGTYLIYLTPGLVHGALAKKYHPPKSHHCNLPGVLCSLRFKCMFAAINNTSDGLTALKRNRNKMKNRINSKSNSSMNLTL